VYTYDILVIGGGINGCGIARDAVGRGLSVCLCEMNDLASGTSSGSSKLVHGGLRYLEHYEFSLVRESLIEREVLWSNAPHVISPLRFVLPHHTGLRAAWFLRLGLLIYDNIGGRRDLPPTKVLDLHTDPAGRALKYDFSTAFEYSDCRVDDARLVVLNALDAARRGAAIHTRSRVVSAHARDGGWLVTFRDEQTGEETEVTARVLVNAAGPWVDSVLGGAIGRPGQKNVRLVQGSHIVVRRLFEHDRCYTFQEEDGRIVFAIPFEDDFTLIGTTDREFDGDPGEAEISRRETDYLLEAAAEYFVNPPTRDDIVWSYTGVRALYDDGASKAQEATRNYVIKTERFDGAPAITIFGGKITTYRRLSQEVVEKIGELIENTGIPWTERAALPGGDFPVDGLPSLQAELVADHGYLSETHAARLTRHYGTEARDLLAGCRSVADLGDFFGADLYEREVVRLMDEEWAICADDVVWRRTKLGLRLDATQIAELDSWMRNRASGKQE
jgi:glycerol-3-phosphate dehydrogenase